MPQRDLTPAVQQEFVAKDLRVVVFCKIEFARDTSYLWSGLGEVPWNGHTWQGLGSLASISSITESADIAANGITITLSGIDTALLDYCMSEIRPDKKVWVWFGARDPNGYIVADPYLAFVGFCDVPTPTDSGTTCTISLTVEPRWLDRRARVWLFTQDDQEAIHPGTDDTGLRFLKDVDKEVTWGGATVTYGGDGGGAAARAAQKQEWMDSNRF